jgi:hypothetical protein
MKFQVGFSGSKYIVICLTTGAVKGSFFTLDKEARDKAERELLVAVGC